MKLWVVCPSYPVTSEVIVVTEFEELLQQGLDALLVPLRENQEPATRGNFLPERVTRPARWPTTRVGQFLLALNVAVKSPWRFVLCLGRAFNFLGDGSRDALSNFLRIASAQNSRPQPDHVHAHFGGPVARIASLLAIYYGCAWSTTVHANDIYIRPARLTTDLRDAVFVRTISQHGRDWVLRNYPGLKQSQVPLIHCGVDTLTIQVPEKDATGESPARLLSVGRLVPKKGHDILVEACALLRDKGHAIKCDIIGEGPERSKLENLITRKNLSSVVTLLGGLPRSAVLERLAQSTIMVLAAREGPGGDREGIPLVLMEAMAMGKPVIAGQVGGVAELVTQGGTVIPGINPELLAGELERYLGMAVADRENIGRMGRKRVEEDFSLQKNVAELATFFDNVMRYCRPKTNSERIGTWVQD